MAAEGAESLGMPGKGLVRGQRVCQPVACVCVM
jgi:hypothetical protein